MLRGTRRSAALAEDNLAVGVSAVLVAPFTMERRDPRAWEHLQRRMGGSVASARLVWLRIPADEVVRRVEQRGAARDLAKLRGDWPAGLDLDPPPVPHIEVDALGAPAVIADGRRVLSAFSRTPSESCTSYEEASRMATMREVAERAGVSAKTVSRVLRNDRYVSDSVRERVNAAVNDLQYVPNMLAVCFRSGRDAAIGVAVPDIADPFFAQIIQAVEVEARARRHSRHRHQPRVRGRARAGQPSKPSCNGRSWG